MVLFIKDTKQLFYLIFAGFDRFDKFTRSLIFEGIKDKLSID